MSKTVDQRVVEMQFDNKQFEKNAEVSMSTLDKLKEKLNMHNAAKSFEEVNKAANKVDMSGLGSAIESVQVKFSALEVMATTALANITNSAVNAGKKMIASLSIDQVSSGWDKYAQKTTSVATLISQGYSQEVVDEQLERLNWFTDETSYNFTEMVSSISKFTASGQDLETSVSAMEGIANWAALSGQNAATASRAMYQLSQAMGNGVMRLEDYKSIQNANMDTEEFRQKCLDTAVALGTLQKNADGTYRSLRTNSSTPVDFTLSQFTKNLTDGLWFTSDVMMSVFNQYGAAVDQIYDYANEKSITASEAISELEGNLDEFGLKAFRAAQEAKTFGDAIDATKDAVSTGWMNTFELIFGNYEQQRVLWTDLANELYDVFASGAEARNELLEGWNELGGRDALIEAFANVWKAIKKVVKPIKEAFREIFPPATAEQLYSITERLRDFTANLELSAGASEKLKNVSKTVFSAIKRLKTIIVDIVKVFKTWIDALLQTQTAQNGIAKLTSIIKDAVTLSSTYLQYGSGAIGQFVENLRNIDSISFENIQKSWKTFVGNVKENAKTTVTDIIPFSNIFSSISAASTNAQKSASAALTSISSDVNLVCNSVEETSGKAINYLSKEIGFGEIATIGLGAGLIAIINKLAWSLKTVVSPLETLTGIGKEAKNVLTAVKKVLNTYNSSITGKTKGILRVAEAIAILAGSLALLSLCDQYDLRSATGALVVLTGVMVGIYWAISRIGTLDKFKATMTGMSLLVISLSASILLLSTSLKILDTLNSPALLDKIVGLVYIMIALGVAVSIISRIAPELKGMIGVAIACTSIAYAVSTMLHAFSDLKDSNIAFDTIGIIILGLTALALACQKLTLGVGVALLGTAAAINLVIIAFRQIEVINMSAIAKNIQALASVFVAFAVLIAATHLASGNTWQVGVSMLGMASALILVSIAFKMINKIDSISLKKAKNTVTQIFIVFALVTAATKHTGQYAWQAGITLMAMAGALIIVSAALVVLGKTNLAQVERALGVVSILEILFAGLIAVTYFSKDCKATLVIIATTIGVLAMVLGSLSAITPENLKSATLATGVVMILLSLIIFVTKYMSEATQSVVALIAIAGIVAGIGLMFSMMKDLKPDKIVSIAESISLILVAMGAMLLILGNISFISVSAYNGITVMTVIVGALAWIMYKFAEVSQDLNLSSMLSVAESLSLLLIAMSGSLWILSAVGATGPAVAIGITALAGLILSLALLGTVFGDEIASGMDGFTKGLPQVATNLSNFMTNLGPFIEGANKITPEMASCLDIFIDAISHLIRSDILHKISEALFGEDDMSGWAEKLSNFGKAIKEFAKETDGISSDSLSGAASAGAVLVELAKTVPNTGGFISFLTGDNELGLFAEQIKIFGQALASFAEETKDIKEGQLDGAVGAGQALADLASSIPNSGGLIWAFIGDNNIDDFGNRLEMFGIGIAKFAKAVDGVDAKAVEDCIPGAEALVKIADIIPNEGGALGFFIGENNLDTFGNQLEDFGNGIYAYSKAVKDTDINAIIDSEDAVTALAGIASQIPNDGGVFGSIFGNSDIQKFGTGLQSFGNGIAAYSRAMKSLNAEDFQNDVNLITTLVTNIQNIKSMVAGVGDLESLTEFSNSVSSFGNGVKTGMDAMRGTTFTTLGTEIAAFGQSLLSYYNCISAIKSDDMEQNSQIGLQLSNVADAIKTIANCLNDEAVLNEFFTYGQTIMTKMGEGVEDEKPYLKDKILGVASLLVSTMKSYYTATYNAGKYLVAGFARGIENNSSVAASAARKVAEAAKTAMEEDLDEHSPSKEGYRIGNYLGQGFSNSLYDYASKAYEAGSSLASSAKEGLKNAVSKITSIIEGGINTQPTIQPILDLSNITSETDKLSAMLSTNQAMSISAQMQRQADEALQNGALDNATGNSFNFTQNNYSPKALSRIEIYRQTKNQFSAMKGLVST